MFTAKRGDSLLDRGKSRSNYLTMRVAMASPESTCGKRGYVDNSATPVDNLPTRCGKTQTPLECAGRRKHPFSGVNHGDIQIGGGLGRQSILVEQSRQSGVKTMDNAARGKRGGQAWL